MGTILALDVGDSRVGTALGEQSSRHASPYKTFDRAKGVAEAAILKIVEERQIKTLVVGMPLSADGQRTQQCEKVENFCRRLQKRAVLEIHYVDEHLTTEEAKQRLRLNGASERQAREKGTLDSMSAAIILEEYFNTLT